MNHQRPSQDPWKIIVRWSKYERANEKMELGVVLVYEQGIGMKYPKSHLTEEEEQVEPRGISIANSNGRIKPDAETDADADTRSPTV